MSSFDLGLKVLARRLHEISEIEGPRAVSSALNKTAALIKTQVVRDVAKEVSVPVKVIREKAYIKPSTSKTLMARLSLYRTEVAAISLGTAKTASLKRRGGRGGNTTLWVGRRRFDGAFITQIKKTGQFHVVKRTGKVSLKSPDKPHRRPWRYHHIGVEKISIATAVDKFMDKYVPAVMSTNFTRLLKRDLEYRIKKYGG